MSHVEHAAHLTLTRTNFHPHSFKVIRELRPLHITLFLLASDNNLTDLLFLRLSLWTSLLQGSCIHASTLSVAFQIILDDVRGL